MLLIPLNKHEVEALLSDPALRIVLCLLVAALRERRSFASWWCLILGAWGILILASKWQKIKFSPFKCRRSIRPLPGKRWRGGGGLGLWIKWNVIFCYFLWLQKTWLLRVFIFLKIFIHFWRRRHKIPFLFWNCVVLRTMRICWTGWSHSFPN